MRRVSSVYDCREGETTLTDRHGPRSHYLPSTVFTERNETYAACRRRRGWQAGDLATADGTLAAISHPTAAPTAAVVVEFLRVDPLFRAVGGGGVGAEFVLKSSIAQLGVVCESSRVVELSRASLTARVEATLVAIAPLGEVVLRSLEVGCRVGKLVAIDSKRAVRHVDYLTRLSKTVSMHGLPLLAMDETVLDTGITEVDGRVVVMLPLQSGKWVYDEDVVNLVPTMVRALKNEKEYKNLLRLHQHADPDAPRMVSDGEILLVRTRAFYAATMFGRVVKEMLPPGMHVASHVIEAGVSASEDGCRTFVLYGSSKTALTHIPVELYTLESYKECMPYRARRKLPSLALDSKIIVEAFRTIPHETYPAATFVCKGGMLREISAGDWVLSDPSKQPYDPDKGDEQKHLVEQYTVQQAEYGILSAIAAGDITSEGILMTRYFPSPILKPLLLARTAVQLIHSVYFTSPSRSSGMFFSQEDGAMLADLTTFGIQTFYVDLVAGTMYKFVLRPFGAGMFVPLTRLDEFHDATFFGVYGSNLVSGSFETELRGLLEGILKLRKTCTHPFLHPTRSLALITGGGPGAMEVGNRVAKSLGILSCGMFVDFGSLSKKPGATINEQKKNPFVEAFMTYRPDKLVERQSDFQLDFPIFLTGGIGTDFEYALEEVRRKVGTVPAHPLILFGTPEHWGAKIQYRFQTNLESGTIKGSEWISNVPWIVRNGAEALWTLTQFFEGKLPIGPKHPMSPVGYMVAPPQS